MNGCVTDKLICQPIIGICLYPPEDSHPFLLPFYFALLDCQQPLNRASMFPWVEQEHISIRRGRCHVTGQIIFSTFVFPHHHFQSARYRLQTQLEQLPFLVTNFWWTMYDPPDFVYSQIATWLKKISQTKPTEIVSSKAWKVITLCNQRSPIPLN